MPDKWKLRVTHNKEGSLHNKPEFLLKCQEIAKNIRISMPLAQILFNRGITNAEDGRQFLSPRLDDLGSPFSFNHMEKAVQRIMRAVRKQEKVLIHGDYDVDGMTAVVIVYNLLRLLGCPCEYYIPDRLTEGYGIRPKKIIDAYEKGFSLIITVDCGITSSTEITLAKSLGIDVILTDHHELLEQSADMKLNNAYAVINPKLDNCGYAFRELSGSGVAFKLCCAIIETLSSGKRNSEVFRDYMLDAIALITLGTIADVVPLISENRILVKFGLNALEASRNCGLRALLELANLDGKTAKAMDIAFRIAPKLNAAGRMGRVELAMKLLLSDSTQEATLLARELERENRRRQKIEAEILSAAREKAVTTKAHEESVLFIWGESWHSGVIGIVAARLAEEFERPAIIITVDKNKGKGKGTARSIFGFNIFELLRSCEKDFLAFGGHSLAAGFEIPQEKIETVNKKIIRLADDSHMEDTSSFLEIDLGIPLSALSMPMV
ncbi:MAG: single-stranded-DNA-specific exonuclease RecJ, partial [Planctomycetota bacterium]